MRNWTEGYPEGVDYIYGYQPGLNPLRIRLALLNVGIVSPVTMTACELGFGQGVSINLHAAASTTQWFGTDFNPAHVAFATDLAAASGAATNFSDQSFAEYCSRADLPDFDFIGVHGVWSWISDENRRLIVDFVKRKLKPGGVFHIGYNILSGYAAFMPMQELLTAYVNGGTASGHGVLSLIDPALQFAEKVLAASPLYTEENPHVATRLALTKSQNRTYVVHEFINRSWTPMSFLRLAEWLVPAKLTYACSASFFEMVDAWNLTNEQQELMKEIPDFRLRETVRDFMTKQTFRRDYWIRGARRFTVQEKMESWRNQRVVLAVPPSDVSVEAETRLGKFTVPKSVSDPILDALADHQPKTLGQIERAVSGQVTFADIVHIALTLAERDVLFPAQDEIVISAARQQTDKLNALLCDRARFGVMAGVLASPVIGTGLFDLARVEKFFLQAMKQGKIQPVELVTHAAQIFRSEGTTLFDEEKVYMPPDGNFTALTAAATNFLQKKVPILKALRVL